MMKCKVIQLGNAYFKHKSDRLYILPNLPFHVEVEKSYYSVPYQLINQQVDVRITDNTVEILSRGNRVVFVTMKIEHCET